jgi:hypothetical protein
MTIYTESPKARVSIELGTQNVIVTAATVDPETIERIDGKGESMMEVVMDNKHNSPYVFFNKRIRAPVGVLPHLGKMMGVHAIMRVGLEGEENEVHRRAIDYELAYAKNILTPTVYDEYIKWRKGVEKTSYFDGDFDQRVGQMVGNFPNLKEEIVRMASRKGFVIVARTEPQTFRIQGDGMAIDTEGNRIEVHRSTNRRRARR